MRNIIYIFLFLVLIVILLGYVRKPLYNEGFEGPERSTSGEVGEGASEYWGWGYQGIGDRHKKRKRRQKKCPKCDHVYISDDVCNIVIDDRHQCKHCDITKNKDIDKYVLKSSIPPCPDMSKFATKAMVQSCPDMNKYVLKSKLPEYCEAYWPHSDKYMLKSKCKPHIDKKYQIVYNDITQHHDYHKYMSKEHCKQYKKSWIQNFEEWWESMFGGKKKFKFQIGDRKHGNFPTGYSFSPYAGYGTNNAGYGLDGSDVSRRQPFPGPEI